MKMPCSGLHVLTALVLVAAVGCFTQPPPDDAKPKDIPRETRARQSEGDARQLKIEVIGTYRNGDADYVQDQIESMLPTGVKSSSWGAGGNTFTYEFSAVVDPAAFAKQIRFGKVVHVDANLIRVYFSYDQTVPASYHKELTGYHQPPEDPLGPALKKHHGDWLAALKELRMMRQQNDKGEILMVALPSMETSDETMFHIAELKSLKELRMSMCRHVTDKGAAHLAGLTNLESLNMFATSIGNPGQASLSKLTKLKTLSLSGNGTEEGLRHLTNLKQLESLSIGFGLGYPVTVDGLKHIQELHQLKLLRLDGCEISDEGLHVIASFSKMETLSLKDGVMSDAGLAHLSTLIHLKGLGLNECKNISDAGLVHLRPLVDLKSLDLANAKVTDEGLIPLLDRLTQLRYLNLSGTQISDASLPHIAAAERLTVLSLADTTVSDSGVRQLPQLPKLHQLILSGTKISDDAIAHLQSFSDLRNIWLSNTEITDEALRHLSEMPGLELLKLDGTKVSDAGMKHLAELKNLREIDVSRTDVTKVGLEYLKACPKLQQIQANQPQRSYDVIDAF